MLGTRSLIRVVVLLVVTFSFAAWLGAQQDKPAEKPSDKVSYHKQIRPIFQANCQGCHQPAKAGGEYVMTDFAKLLKGGESAQKSIVPGKPDESNLVDLITPIDGKAEMPRGKQPLAESDIDLIKRWIAQGAADDTPEDTRKQYDMQHPPEYTRLPVVTALDYSPDGQLLAVAGFHEVLLWKADGSELVSRLVGLSERIESVRFSLDGKRLAITGGLPGRVGELQVWEVESKKLLLSLPVTYDTIYGGNWSPDGKLISFGCSDNTVRAVDSKTGEQVLFQGAHSDWVFDTVFSADGSHVASVGRDMTTKLTEVATQRFVDNITSITPGALKGGIGSVARHPARDEIVIGGSDGVVKVYRMHRLTKRVIGDDANQIRKMPPMPGRIFSVAVSRDGKRIAAGSSLDGTGEVHVYSYEFDTGLPDDIKRINEKVASTRTEPERVTLENYLNKDVKQIARTPLKETGIYAVAFHPEGKVVAAAGADGLIRFLDAESGSVVKQFASVPVRNDAQSAAATTAAITRPVDPVPSEHLPVGAKLVGLDVQPQSIEFKTPFDYTQLLVTGKLESGDVLDVTRMVQIEGTADIASLLPGALITPKKSGETKLRLTLAGQSATVAVNVSKSSGGAAPVADYIRDVAPVLSKLGCTQGTCHGSAQGKNGFKLSLRGYDGLFDVRAFTDDLASRRVNVASPDDSLMLLKASGNVPHVGGQLTKPDEAYYELIRSWIAGGAKLDMGSPRVTRIEVSPSNPVIQRIGDKQQVRVVATYADGRTRDVTQEVFIDSGNTEVATTNKAGLMTAVRRGEAPILARYEGAYAATTLTVMGDRRGFVWKQPETWGRVDELVANKWQRMKIEPSGLCNDAEFIRRVSLDLTGLPPTADEVRDFLADSRDTRVKRDELIDKLIGSPAFVEYWTNKWADLLQVNRKFLGAEGASAFRQWIKAEVEKNTPYDQFVRAIITASGSNKENPAAAYYKILRDPTNTMENTTHLFLGVRFNCNKCHDHPFERWTQDQYYQTSAYFAQVSLKTDPASGKSTIGGTAVEGAKPLYEIVYDKPDGDIKHERTGQVTAPNFPFACQYTEKESASRREQLAGWLTSADNAYFAKSYVNRLWGYLFGIGIMEPIDDLRAGNPPSNPELLDYLTQEFIKSNFNARHVINLITKSRTYQLSYTVNNWNDDDKTNYSHALARRLPAEVLYDTVHRVVGAQSKFPGVKAGTRAAELPDSGIELPSGFLNTFGRPARESACECERSSGLQLGPVMALISGPTIADAIADPANDITKLVASQKDDRALVNEIVLRILNRGATEEEINATLEIIGQVDADHAKLLAALKEREAYVASIKEKQEKDREAAIVKAKAAAEAFEKEIAPKVAELEKVKQAKTAELTEDLKKYETTLPAKVAEYEKKQMSSVEWIPLRPASAKGFESVKLIPQDDRSIVASGTGAKGVFTITARTDLKNITALRLEAIADSATGKGPGLANNNFVLTEFEVNAAPLAKPKEMKQVFLQKPLADFAQENFPITAAIDNDVNNGNLGWAVSPSFGVTHWATFETKEALGHEGGTLLTFTLHHKFRQPNFFLGRFRISVAVAKPPVGLSLAEELQAILATPAAERDAKQQASLAKYYRGIDPELRKKEAAVAESKKPLPVDPHLQELRDKLELVSRPIPPDGKLVQLKQDVEQSAKQLTDKRLTAAQDLAWALINSPAFLFNH